MTSADGFSSSRFHVAYGAAKANSPAPPRPMDIANGVLFLSSSLSARVTGQTLVVDGGATTRSPWGFTEESLTAFKDGWREERN